MAAKLALATVALALAAGDPSPLVVRLAEAELDWRSATVAVRAGAAADPLRPDADRARNDARRRARGRADDMLRAALARLPWGPDRKVTVADVDRGLAAARETVTWESNGGAFVDVTVKLDDVLAVDATKAAAPVVLAAVGAMVPVAVPVLRVGDREVPVAMARYRTGAAPPAAAVKIRVDGEGRLVAPRDALAVAAGSPVVLEVHLGGSERGGK